MVHLPRRVVFEVGRENALRAARGAVRVDRHPMHRPHQAPLPHVGQSPAQQQIGILRVGALERGTAVAHAVLDAVGHGALPLPMHAVGRAQNVALVVRGSVYRRADNERPWCRRVLRLVENGRPRDTADLAQIEDDVGLFAVVPAVHVQLRPGPVDAVRRGNQADGVDDLRVGGWIERDVPGFPEAVLRVNVDAGEIDDPLALPGRAHGVERVGGVLPGLMDDPLEADGLLDDLIVQEQLRAAWIHGVFRLPCPPLPCRATRRVWPPSYCRASSRLSWPDQLRIRSSAVTS